MQTLRIDNREHDLVRIMQQGAAEFEIVALEVGDIEFIAGDQRLILERKSLADLKASIRDGRYREQKGRLKAATPHAGYIIEGSFVIGEEDPSIVGAVLNTLLRDRMIVLFSANTRETARYVQEIWKRLDKYLVSEAGAGAGTGAGTGEDGQEWIHTVKTKVRRIENIDPSTSTMMMLCQIPGISSRIAQNIYEACCTATGVSEETGGLCMTQLLGCLSGQNGQALLRRIPLVGPKKISTICEYLGINKN